jgi:CRP/FNR family transcriptional regulator, cyclic AMP receptor protein
MAAPEPNIVDLLAASSMLRGLPRDKLELLAKYARVQRFERSSVILRRGERGDALALVMSGRVKIGVVTVEARDITFNFLGVGGMMGELAVFDGGQRTADAVAMEDTEVVFLHRRDLIPVLKSHPDALIEIIGVLCEKLRHASAILEASSLIMSRRLAAALLRLAKHHGQIVDGQTRIDLRLSQTELATYAGLSRENTNRQLNDLRDRGLVSMDKRYLIIADPVSLTEFIESEDE